MFGKKKKNKVKYISKKKMRQKQKAKHKRFYPKKPVWSDDSDLQIENKTIEEEQIFVTKPEEEPIAETTSLEVETPAPSEPEEEPIAKTTPLEVEPPTPSEPEESEIRDEDAYEEDEDEFAEEDEDIEVIDEDEDSDQPSELSQKLKLFFEMEPGQFAARLPDSLPIDQFENNTTNDPQPILTQEKTVFQTSKKVIHTLLSNAKLIILLIFLCGIIYIYTENHTVINGKISSWIKKVTYTRTDMLQDELGKLQKELSESRKIYVYDLKEAIIQSGIVQIKKDFEKKVKRLNKEIDKAKKQIQKIQTISIKKDFAELYVNLLKLKKEALMEEHQKALMQITERLNNALDQIVKEKNIPVIFTPDVVAYSSGNAIDITPEVVKLLKNNQPE